MKKLNRKGFTLVELLAVIVILAIVVSITLVTVLPTLSNSRQKAFETAVDTIKVFVQDEYDKCLIGDTNIAGDAKINFSNCSIPADTKTFYTSVITSAGYSTDDIMIHQITIVNGKVKIVACSDSDGKYNNDKYDSEKTDCSTAVKYSTK